MFHPRWLKVRAFCSLVVNSPSTKIVRKLPSDPVLAEIIQSDSLSNVWKVSHNYGHTFAPEHIAMTCSKLLEISRENKEYVDKIVRHSKFELLCEQALKKIYDFNTDEIMSVLKALTSLNISPHTNIFKSFVILTQNHINKLDSNHLTNLYLILSKNEKTVPISTLLKSIPLALQNQLEFCRFNVSIKDLVYSLKISLENNLDETFTKELIRKTCSEAKDLQISLLVSFLHQIGSSKTSFNVVERMQPVWFDILIEKFHELDSNQMIVLLRTLRKLNWFSMPFFEQLSSKALEDKWNLNLLVPLLQLFNVQQYMREDILELASKAMQEKKEHILNEETVSLGSLLASFTFTENQLLVPQLVNIFENVSPQLTEFEKTNISTFFTHLKNLLFVGIFPENQITKAFRHIDEVLNMNSGPKKYYTLTTLLMIHWITKLEKGQSLHLSESDIGRIIPHLEHDSKLTLKLNSWDKSSQWLPQAIGGEQFVKSGCWSKEAHYIDHLLLLNKETGTFLDVSAIEKLKNVPSNILKIAVMELQGKDFCKNSYQMKKNTSMKMKTLSKLGYHLLPINTLNFGSLIDDQKILYLRKKIDELKFCDLK